MPDLYTRNEYGRYVPFDAEIYEQEIWNRAYATARKKNNLRRERKKQAKRNKIIGLLIILFTFFVCKMIVAIGESDVTFAVIILPIAFMILFED